ncbi:hypothetical protein CY34DRAFT_100657 [Suillus luteus UH-Slu-Lm8-n1]|uniref:Uncharacterized protein n=1 Tax=Suillus luteus UH-Slu-Lm8-n1 TaxID=930992 RepID=A0A0D0ALQ7_9AGAM|nr:hypothetical protein CY34DRAFT_100657 [Suillus luteus UH-Slu-Lm8-n1]
MINGWIAGILLFSFELVHVPASKHTGADSLSRRPAASEDPPDDNDHECWLDHSYSFGIAILNDRTCVVPNSNTCILPHTSLANCPKHPSCLLTYLGAIGTTAEEGTIPRSEAAKAKDQKLKLIQQFLTNRQRPSTVTEEDYEQFIQTTARYFILEGNLWRWHPEGKHQLVVPEGKHYRILKGAHDDLGHKGIFTT